MRISDWSSDVCSSDLHAGALHRGDVNECVVSSALRRDEPIALVGIEEFYSAGDHVGILYPNMTGMRQRRRIPASVRLERDKRNRLAGSISVAGDVSGPGFSRYHVEKQNRSPCRRSVTTPPSTIVSTVDHEKTGNLEIREGVNQDHLAR